MNKYRIEDVFLNCDNLYELKVDKFQTHNISRFLLHTCNGRLFIDLTLKQTQFLQGSRKVPSKIHSLKKALKQVKDDKLRGC